LRASSCAPRRRQASMMASTVSRSRGWPARAMRRAASASSFWPAARRRWPI